jgi:hypothetical protein
MATDRVKSGKTEAPFVVDLKKKPMQELLSFIANPWTASILTPKEIEEIHQSLKQEEVTSPDETEVNFVEMGLD